MPFGLTNAPASFQCLMNDIFSDMTDIFVIIYLDDILIFSKSEGEHRRHVRQVLDRLRRARLFAKAEKCEFHRTSVDFLGFTVSPSGVSVDPSRIEAVTSWPTPTRLKALQSFLGFANFYRRFIADFSGIVTPLTRLTRKSVPFVWSEQCQHAFDLLKSAFVSVPVLAHFRPELRVTVETDASDYALAGILSQTDESGTLHPVAFHSRALQPAKLNYEIHDKELLAIHDCFRVWHPYLEGAQHRIETITDHRSLEYFSTTKQLTRRQARWAEYLSGFDYVVRYRPGRLGGKPDALTRRDDVYPPREAGT
jgi:hypothetical protein